MLLLLIVAFLAGVVTVLSPCILPVLPIVLGASVGGDRRRPYLVIAGLVMSFSFFTLASYQIVAALHLPSDALRLVAVVIIAFLGLSLLVPRVGLLLERALAGLPGRGAWLARSGRLGGLLTGVGLGLVWAPCAGPILGAITSLAITQPGSNAALALVVVYALGAGVPLLAIAMGGRRLLALRPASGVVQRLLGALILATAALMAVNADVTFTTWATAALPDWTNTLQTLERTGAVQSQISQLTKGNPGNVASTLATPPPAGSLASLPPGPPAPEFTGITHWLNSDPLTLASLRGKVVLIDFWTYSCINCLRTLPYVEGWYQKYAADGFVVIGVHTPEFTFEHDTDNVAAALVRLGITYPVAQDNNFATWQAWGNQYWPADYLIDAQGQVRETHAGEGDYPQTEEAIRALLAERDAQIAPTLAALPAPPAGTVPITATQTPETYLGTNRQQGLASPQAVVSGQVADYTIPDSQPANTFAVAGSWTFAGEQATANAAGDRLRLRFTARDVYLVITSATPAQILVRLLDPSLVNTSEDVGPGGVLAVTSPRLYHLVHLAAVTNGEVELTLQTPGVQAYAFTFGS